MSGTHLVRDVGTLNGLGFWKS